jgi:hypothetical protein
LSLALGVTTTQASGIPAARWRMTYLSRVSNTNLSSVLATGPASAWAIGNTKSGRTFVMRWNGTHWRWIQIPGSANFQANTLAATGPDDVWAFGINTARGEDLAFRFDGTAWHRISMPDAGSPGSPVVLSPASAYFIGAGFCVHDGARARTCSTDLWHWNGRSWAFQVIDKLVVGLAAISASQVDLAALTFVRFPPGNGTATGRLAVFSSDGQQWRRVPFTSPRVVGDFVTIAATSAKAVWIVARPASQKTQQPAAFHFNGRSWTEVRVPATEPAQLYPALIDGHGGVWFGPWVHWTGRKWVNASPAGGFPGVDCLGVNAMSRIPGSSEILSAGWAHRIGSHDSFNAMTAIYQAGAHSKSGTRAPDSRDSVCVTAAG